MPGTRARLSHRFEAVELESFALARLASRVRGSVAATVIVALAVWRTPSLRIACRGGRVTGDTALDAVDMLADGEVLDLWSKRRRFYEWLDVTSLDAAGSAG